MDLTGASAIVDLSAPMTKTEAKAEFGRMQVEYNNRQRAGISSDQARLADLEDAVARGQEGAYAEWQEHTRKMSRGSEPSAPPQSTTSYSAETVGPDQFPHRENEAWFAGLRERGLRANTEQYMRDRDAGKPVPLLSAGEGAAVEQRLRQLENMPGFGKKINPKDPAFDPKAHDLWMRLTVAINNVDRGDAREVPQSFYENLNRHIREAGL